MSHLKKFIKTTHITNNFKLKLPLNVTGIVPLKFTNFFSIRLENTANKTKRSKYI